MVFPNSTDSGSDQTTQKRLAVSEMLFAYGEVEGIAQEMEQPASEHMKAASTLSTCLLCLQSFTPTTFEPFSCPECQRQGKEEYRIERASEWIHGFINTPVLFTKSIVKPKPMATTTKSKSAPCLRCGQLFYAGNKPFDCPKCKGEGENIQINDLASWLTHTSDVHGCNGQTGVVIDKECLPKQGQKKRKRENIVEEAIKRSKLES
ncbi:hypothetical protein B0H65DRAFT_459438 [Neurospora tetraspora]|uniref:Uncharacterized protein n=1 Tax=Neurospora tetraspora TaxID=94610 RepID=A0AAE0MUW2_9PEZI|nr:hypothetical protein B0H65DRAFT_459438 [Neurospora tetraspora]